MKRRGRGLAAATLLAMTAIAAGCGDSDDDGGSGGDTGKERVKVYMLLPSLQDESYVRKLAGAKAEAAKHPDADVTIETGTERSEPSDLIRKLEGALTKGADVLAVDAGAVPKELTPVLQGAVDQGVPVIASGIELNDVSPRPPFVGVDELTGSAPGGKFVNEKLPKGGELGILSCYAENPITVARTEGFKRGLEGGKVKIVSVLDPKCDPEKARSNMENMLTAHPGLDAVYSVTDIAAFGALEHLRSLNKDLVFVGHDALKDAVAQIARGDILDATITTPFEESGAETVRSAIAAARDEKLPTKIVLPQELVTQENADEFMKKLDATTDKQE